VFFGPGGAPPWGAPPTATRPSPSPASPSPATTPGAFTIAMRDFAVAATLATQAFGPGAGTVPGVHGVLMLIGGSLAATTLRHRGRS
jgi:hypothetical protein